MDDQRGRGDQAQERHARARREHGGELPLGAACIGRAALEVLLDAFDQHRARRRMAWAADQLPDAHAVGQRLLERWTSRRREEMAQHVGPRPRQPVVARGRHDRGERSHPRRLPGRDDLAQHAAHRDAHQMHRPRAQVLEQAAQVIGHVVQQVGRAAGEPQPMAQVDPRHARAARQPAGLAHVAVVEAHHTQASLYQRTHERGRPCGQLLAQAVDQHQAAAHAVAARRVGDAQPTELTKLHIRGHETCLGTGSCGRKGWWLRHATGERERRSGWADKHGVTIGGHDARARRRETTGEYGGAARRVGVTGGRDG